MQVTQEKRPGSRIGLTIVVEAEQVKQTYEKTLRKLVQSFQVPGFRKGKAPRQLVLQQVGSQRVSATAMDEVMNTAIRDALKSQSIQPVSQFEIETPFDELFQSFKADADFSFSGWVEVFPTVVLGPYKNLSLTVTRVDPDPAQIDQRIDDWREQRATLVPVNADRPAQMGDFVTVDFEGFDEEGNLLEGASAEEFEFDLVPENKFITGFVDGIVGMTLEETREIEAEFPEDYFQPELAGKKATFKVILHDVKAKELPELNDEFVEQITQGEMHTVEQLREYLSQQIERQARQECLNAIDDAILDAITGEIGLDIPESMLEEEVTSDLTKMMQELQGSMNLTRGDVERFLKSLPPENLEKLRSEVRPKAEKRLRRSLALGEIVRQEGIQVGSTELDVAVEQVITARQTPATPKDRREIASILTNHLLTNKVVAWLREQNTITWVDAEGNPVPSPLDPQPQVTSEQTPVDGDGLEAEAIVESADTSVESVVAAAGVEAEPSAEPLEADPETPEPEAALEAALESGQIAGEPDPVAPPAESEASEAVGPAGEPEQQSEPPTADEEE